MFSIESQEGVFFESSWKSERLLSRYYIVQYLFYEKINFICSLLLIYRLRYRSVKDSFAQTSEIITYEADAQSVFRKDIEVCTTLNI